MAFATLDPAVQRAHLPPFLAYGSLDVQHGSHALTPVLIRILKLPTDGLGQPVRLEVASANRGVVWMRRIGGSVLHTFQRARGTRIVEYHGFGCVEFELQVVRGSLAYRQAGMRVCRIPVPAFIRPHVRACVSAAPRGWHVEVVVTWRTHLVCRYSGVMSVA